MTSLRILIVEDEFIIALHIQAIVESLGCLVSGPVSSAGAAIELLRVDALDAALLDVNLQGTTVLPVAQECRLRNIPLILITAYGQLPLDDRLLNDAIRIRKPFSRGDIVTALSSVIGSGR